MKILRMYCFDILKVVQEKSNNSWRVQDSPVTNLAEIFTLINPLRTIKGLKNIWNYMMTNVKKI